MAAAVRVVFTAHEADPAGHMWVTAQVGESEPTTIGYTRVNGEGVAAHGSGLEEDWPQVAVCADSARALGALIAEFGRQLADCIQPEGMMET